jgi:hypothetical protein
VTARAAGGHLVVRPRFSVEAGLAQVSSAWLTLGIVSPAHDSSSFSAVDNVSQLLCAHREIARTRCVCVTIRALWKERLRLTPAPSETGKSDMTKLT